MTAVVPVSPSLPVAVTMNVCEPAVVVSIDEPDGWPFGSGHDAIALRPASSVQVKLESTNRPWL